MRTCGGFGRRSQSLYKVCGGLYKLSIAFAIQGLYKPFYDRPELNQAVLPADIRLFFAFTRLMPLPRQLDTYPRQSAILTLIENEVISSLEIAEGYLAERSVS